MRRRLDCAGARQTARLRAVVFWRVAPRRDNPQVDHRPGHQTPVRRYLRRDRRRWVRALGPSLLLGLLAGALLPAAVLGRGVLYERDIQLLWQPQVESFVRCLAAGSWPLWDPWISFGVPMLANPNAQILYPTTWLNAVLPAPTAYTLFAWLHLTFAGVGTFVLARGLRLSRPAAVLAGALWVASGPFLSLVNVWNHLAGAAWVPWVLAAGERALRRPSPARAAAWAATLALQLFAGSPDFSAFTLGLCAVLVAVRLVVPTGVAPAPRRRVVVWAATAAALGAGLAALQWLPALEASSRGLRANLAAAYRVGWSVHPVGLAEILSPVPWTDLPLADAARALLYGGGHPLLHGLYLGLPALALAGAGLLDGPLPRRMALVALLGLGAVLYALGPHLPVYGVLETLVPPVRMLRYPSKAIVLAALAVALLAGFGFDRWRRARRAGEPRPSRGAVLVAAVTALGVTTATVLLARPDGPFGAWLLDAAVLGAPTEEVLRPFLWRGALAGALALVTLALAIRRPARAATVVALVAVLDLVAANHSLNRTAPPDFYRYRPPALDDLAQGDGSRLFVYRYSTSGPVQHPGLPSDNPWRIRGYPEGFTLDSGRTLAVRLYLIPPVGAVWRVFGSHQPDLVGLHPWTLRIPQTRLALAEGQPAWVRWLRLGAVSQVLALHDPGVEALEPQATYESLLVLPIRLFRVRSPLPRAYAVGRAVAAVGPEALRLLESPGFDPTTEVVVAHDAARGEAAAFGVFEGRVTRLDLGPDRVRLETELSQPGYVVLVDSWDPGWRATVDGRPAPLLRANVAFRAVPVPAGRHVIEQRYRPRSVVLGLLISLVSLAVALTLGRSPGRSAGATGRRPAP
jgi:hypothetical protein